MGTYCYQCKHIDVKDTKKACNKGCKHYCHKKMRYVVSTNVSCYDFLEDKKRKKDDLKKLIKDGQEHDDDNVPALFLILLLIIMLIVGLFSGMFDFSFLSEIFK